MTDDTQTTAVTSPTPQTLPVITHEPAASPPTAKPLVFDDILLGTAPYIFKDRLIMFKEDYDKLSADEITALKQARYDTWYNHLMNASAAVPDDTSLTDVTITDTTTNDTSV
jgi:hypothetical protein